MEILCDSQAEGRESMQGEFRILDDLAEIQSKIFAEYKVRNLPRHCHISCFVARRRRRRRRGFLHVLCVCCRVLIVFFSKDTLYTVTRETETCSCKQYPSKHLHKCAFR